MGNVSTAVLRSYGFQEAGRWSLDQAVKSGLRFTVVTHSTDRVIYAFEVMDQVKYIGMCREQDFKTRMKDYQYQGAQEKGGSTNRHVATRIKEQLEIGRPVNILALRPEDKLMYHDLAIDLIAGLEKPLIGLCDPEWNKELQRTREKLTRQALRKLPKNQLESLRESLEKSS